MAFTLISHKPPPNVDPTKAPLAFGKRAIPKLYRELGHPSLVVRQRALMALSDVLHSPEYISEAITVGIISKLKNLLMDEDPTVRIKATEVLYIISGHAIGRDALLINGIIDALTRLFDDEVYEARRNAHRTIEMTTHSPPGPEGVVDCGLIPTIVKKLLTEEDEIKILILDTLHFCMKVNTEQVLQSEGMESLTTLLNHSSPVIRAKSARDVMDLSFPLDGKDAACNCGTVEALSLLLEDKDPEVRIFAAGALMTITITTRGKHAALEAGTISFLVQLLSDQRSEARLNALKVITTLSEAPRGRFELQRSLPAVEQLLHDHESAAVRKAAQIAVKSITWKP